MATFNYYAESPLLERKNSGVFYGLKFRNISKYFKMKICVVCWQTWFIEIYNSRDNTLENSFYIHQNNNEEPVMCELRNCKYGYTFIVKNAEVTHNINIK